MQRYCRFASARSRAVLGIFFIVLAFLALIIGVLLPASLHGTAWALFGLALMGALVSLVLFMRGTHSSPTAQAEEHMYPTRVEALIAFFKAFENRKTPKQPKEPCHLVEQTEEAYQKEQAEWLANWQQKKGNKKGKPPAAR